MPLPVVILIENSSPVTVKRETPVIPNIIPATVSLSGLLACDRTQLKTTIHTGITEHKSAANPEVINCSAHARLPCPMNIINRPVIAGSLRCLNFIFIGLRKYTQAKRSAPATLNRKPAIIKGGMLSSANRIARKVVPHTIYITANAKVIFMLLLRFPILPPYVKRLLLYIW